MALARISERCAATIDPACLERDRMKDLEAASQVNPCLGSAPLPLMNGNRLSKAQIARVTRGHLPDNTYCSQRSIRRSGPLSGTVRVTFFVEPTGAVRATLLENGTGVAELGSCIDAQVRGRRPFAPSRPPAFLLSQGFLDEVWFRSLSAG